MPRPWIEGRDGAPEHNTVGIDQAACLNQREGENAGPFIGDSDRAGRPIAHVIQKFIQLGGRAPGEEAVLSQDPLEPDQLFHFAAVASWRLDMADLAGKAVTAAEQLAVDHNAAANAALDHQTQHHTARSPFNR